jgi:putative DNA primase/helicase
VTSKARYNAAEAVMKTLPPPTGEPDDYWEKNLELTDKLKIVSSLRNAYLILSRDDRWQGVIAFDEFSQQVMKLKAPPFEIGAAAGPWSDADDSRTMIWLAHHYKVNIEHKTLVRAVKAVADDHPIHPVREYFDGLKWDGKARLESWLHEYLGAQANEYTCAVGVKFMVGAVARVMRPGCKMDNVMILEGEQGRWKSTALRVLADPWFMDTPFTIGDKDAYLVIRGSLFVELAELDGFSRAESSRAKAFFSSPTDTFVPKYIAWSIKVPRQCVFVGTVNHGTYLKDSTGNRRYWPVRIEKAAIEDLKRDRDQLWAEAVHLYRDGTRWWVESNEVELFTPEQELRAIGDVYEDKIADYLAGKSETTMEQLLSEGLKLEVAKWTPAEQTRVGNVMQSLGWEKRRRSTGSRGYFYAKRERVPGEEG